MIQVKKKWTTLLCRFLLLYLVTFLIVLPVVCRNLRHSVYFSAWKDQEEGKEELKQQNTVNHILAQQYVDRLRKTHYKMSIDFVPSTVTISTITHARTRFFRDEYKTGYLTQNVAMFLRLIDQHSLNSPDFTIKYFVCNVDPDPNIHREATNLSALVPVLNRFNQPDFPMDHPKEKEKQDYLFCLNKTLEFGSDFVFLVEDDALPRNDTLVVLERVIRSHIPTSRTTSYIKFYHPDRLLGFSFGGVERIPELLSFAVIVSMMLTAAYTKIDLKSPSRSVVCVLFMVYVIAVELAVGRTNLLKLRHVLSPHLYSITPAPSCCTQAVLYPRDSAKSLVTHMASVQCNTDFAKDHVLEQFSAKNNLQAYLVQPSVFTHIGLYSALRNQIVDPFML